MSVREPGTDASFEWLRRAHRSEQAPAALRRRALARARAAGLKKEQKEPRRWLARSAPLALAAAFAGAVWLGLSRHAFDGPARPSLPAQSGVVPTAEPGAPANAAPNVLPSEPSRACPKPLPHSPWNPAELASEANFNGLQVQVLETATAGCGPLTRRYLVSLPEKQADSAPAMIVLHDTGQGAEEALLQTRWWFGELARRTSSVLVYANGGPPDPSVPAVAPISPSMVPVQRNAGLWQTETGAHPAVDDVAYLNGIVDDLNARRALGKGSEVFLAGYGSGATMALVAAMQHPERYSGVAAFLPSRPPRLDEVPRGIRPFEWRWRSIFVVLPSTGDDPSALAWQWAGAFGAEPGPVRVTRHKPGLQRIDTTIPGVDLRILVLPKKVDPFPLPGAGDETARAASAARPFFFDGPRAAWDFFQQAKR